MFVKALSLLVLIGCVLAQDYSYDSYDQSTREQQLAQHNYNNHIYEQARSEPYEFGFQSTDEFGTIMNRQESSDNSGAVRGSYGYTDPSGVFRHVDYIADEFGFRAEVKSNEPGMGTQSPANVHIYAEPPPAGVIVQRSYYNPQGQGAQAGQAGVGQPASRRNPSSSASTNANRQVKPVSSGARVASSSSGSRTAVYPTYVQPQQSAYSNNALSGSQYGNQQGSQYGNQQGSQYGNQQGSQYGNQQGRQYGNQHGSQYGNQYGTQYAASTSNQYPPTVSAQYAANAAAATTSTSSGSQYATGTAYKASAASVYPARNPYGSQGYDTLATSQLGSGRSANTEQPIVAKPYDGPTYKVGNPHVTEYTKADNQKSGGAFAAGGAPLTLVKHIHTYPAAPAA